MTGTSSLSPERNAHLIDLPNVLGRLIALEPAQADLLDRICTGPLQSVEELRQAGALEAAPDAPSVRAKRKA